MTHTSRILVFLRVSLHVLVAVLLVVGLATAWRSPWLVVLAGVFFVVYLAGTVWHKENRPYTKPASWAWLAVVCALWVALALASPAFVWLEFPLVILAIYLLPRAVGVLVSAAVLAFTVSITYPMSGAGGVIGPTIGTLLAILIVLSYKALRAEVEHYKELVHELQAAQLELAAAEHEAGVNQERARLSREVHDTMAQGLSSIVLLGRALDKQITDDDARRTLDTIRRTAADNLAEARRFVAVNAGPREPLPQRIGRLARAAEERQRALGAPLDVRVNAVDVGEPGASISERVVREGLSNVVQHANATEAVVTVDMLGDVVTVDVFDNGRGITGPEGFGLTGLRARVEEAGGELTVEGNVLAATIPLKER
ncbi:sensor histidine kinase [Corynebacterium timonense]|uniref:histidine kinase n=1 Tax=Corynebacterium timonense TaxID=441500 RepID=A0A1H1UQH1_9CORY|nr:histidine kinase [Corynebacterium timonense]SDS74723.1 Signal transduction histidine kinase [Corynebacterium timonense]